MKAYGQAGVCQSFTIDDNLMKLPVSIQGKIYQAVITINNTGASISSNLANELNLVVRQIGNRRILWKFGRINPYTYANNLELNIFGSTITASDIAVEDGAENWIQLSLGVFRGLISQVDFPGKKICLYSRSDFDLPGAENIRFGADAQYGNPMIEVTFNNDLRAWLQILPSYPQGIKVDPELAAELGLIAQAGEIAAAEGNEVSPKLTEIQLGPYSIQNVRVEHPEPGERHNLTTSGRFITGSHIRRGQGYRGRIGIDVLKHFVLTMDLERQQLHIYAPN
tara:strand:- start:250 stop:1092 length:843 start_codon:yes stop_codon:yes gene_type:complete